MAQIPGDAVKARIYQPTKNAMQSGRAKTGQWILEYEPTDRKQIDPLMGWTGSDDTMGQVRLKFDNESDAKAYADRHGIAYNLHQPKERAVRPKAYADNFAFQRKVPWSH